MPGDLSFSFFYKYQNFFPSAILPEALQIRDESRAAEVQDEMRGPGPTANPSSCLLSSNP